VIWGRGSKGKDSVPDSPTLCEHTVKIAANTSSEDGKERFNLAGGKTGLLVKQMPNSRWPPDEAGRSN
jgi:hypothetical protein